MPSGEERMMILRMVEDGKVTPEEGARLLAALGQPEPAAQAANGDAPGWGAPPGWAASGVAADPAGMNYAAAGTFSEGSFANRFFHVRVTNGVTGKQKVNVNIPLGLVDFGLRFVPPSSKVNVQAVRDAITSGVRGKIVEVMDEDKGDRVEIFIE